MSFVKYLGELSWTMFVHFHLLIKQLFHVVNATFCQWPALIMNYYSITVIFSFSLQSGPWIPPLSWRSAVWHLLFRAAGNPGHQWKWPRTVTNAKMAENTTRSDCWLQERNTSIGCGRQSLLVPSTWRESCEKW